MPAFSSALDVPRASPPDGGARAAAPERRRRPGGWLPRGRPVALEYVEVAGVILVITVLGSLLPVSYRAFGHVYLLTVIVLSLRVGRWPVLVAAIGSAVAWDYAIIPPRMSFSTLEFEDDVILGTYFIAALIAGQLTTRIRAQELAERRLKRRATALFHLTHAVAEARSFDEAVAAAMRQAEELFGTRVALLLVGEDHQLTPHAAGSYALDWRERAVADWAVRNARDAGPGTGECEWADALHAPMRREGAVLGLFVVARPPHVEAATPEQRELVGAFAAQIALALEREQLRAASEREKLLVESDRLHRTLLDSVSHELKTPLAVLRAAADGLGSDDPARQRALSGEIRTATRRLERLVANLLDQTRLEAGALRPQLDWCDARDLIATSRRGIGDALAGRAVTVEIAEGVPLFPADAKLMEQVIGNLLLNVALHTPAGTPVTISAGVAADSLRAFIAVADRGPGLAPEMRAHLFEKFRRGPEARAGGVGLGLSIVRGLMLAQKGDIVADEAPGGGARFTVFLPLVPPEAVPVE